MIRQMNDSFFTHRYGGSPGDGWVLTICRSRLLRHKLLLAMIITVIAANSNVQAQILFSEDFNDGNAAARWTSQETGGVNAVDLAYDYIAAGIPAAPNGGGLGLRFDTNLGPTGAISAASAFPNGQSFSGPHYLKFDLWLNVLGTATTEFAIFGVNHTSSTIQTPTGATPGVGPSNNGIDFAITGDNGAARDVRVYVDGAELTGAAGGFAGALQSTQNAPYNTAYDAPIPGNQWLEVEVASLGSRAVLKINGETWAETAVPTASGNIMLGYMDIFASVAPDTVFAVYDNVSVVVPEPSSLALLGMASLMGLTLGRSRRREIA